MNVRFNPEVVQEVHDTLTFICRRAPGENPNLELAIRELRRVGRSRLCRHCGEQMSRRKNRLCDPCNTYASARGMLPPPDVLGRRAG